MFNTSKNEEGNPTKNYKKLVRYLKQNYKCVINKEQLKIQKIKQAKLIVFACPTNDFTEEDISTIIHYIEEGGNCLVLSQESGNKNLRTNLNYLLEKFSIELTNSSVIRTNYFRYFHPKEALVTNGVIHEDFLRAVQGGEEPRESAPRFAGMNLIDDKEPGEAANIQGFKFVYPFGSTLNVKTPAISLLSTGTVCYPVNSHVLGYCQKGKGKIFVGGSWKIFADDYYDKEENAKIFDFILNFIKPQPNTNDKGTKTKKTEFFMPDKFSTQDQTEKPKILPNIEALSEKLKNCVQESPDISGSFLTKFQTGLFEANFNLLPETLALFPKLNIPYGPIKLIPPIFDTPMLGLTPAVFPPILVDLEPPKLELFDLDDEFANQEFVY